MATSDQLARAEAPRIDFEMRFYTGGKWTDADLDNIGMGQPYTPTVETTLAQNLTPTDTTIGVADASQLTTGTIVICPYAGHSFYEVVSYTGKAGNNLTGCVRQVSDDPTFGYHTAGAPVSEWVEITELVENLAETENKQEGIVRWQARLDGVGYNSRLLDNDNAVLCMARYRPGEGGLIDVWTDWEVSWLGYLRDVRVPDDADEKRRWYGTVEGISQYLAATDVSARVYGRQNLAEEKTVTTSSELYDPFQEAGTGEFVGSPDLGGSNVVDEDLATLWISDGEPASTPAGVTEGCHFRINEVYLRAQPGYLDADMQWIEIYCNWGDGQGHNLGYYAIANRDSTWFLNNWEPQQYQLLNNFIQLPTVDVSDGGFVILCANKAIFLERWGSTAADHVIDWRPLTTGEFSLRAAGDKLGLFFWQYDLESTVFWGDETVQNWNPNQAAGWTGDTIPTDLTNMPAGHSFHRKPEGAYSASPSKDNFKLRETGTLYNDNHPTPGAYITGDPEYLSVDMGTMGIALTAQLAIDETDEMSISSTLGLTDGGRVQIDSEQIDYETRDDDANKLLTLTRGVGGTTPAQHNVDAVVKQVEDSVAYEAPLIVQITWRRRRILQDDGSPVVPQNFHIYTSTLESPIYPDDEDWDADWESYWYLRASEEEWVECFYEKTFAPFRARHVMIAVHDMTDGGRVKLNEFAAYAYSLNPIDGQMPDTVRTGHIVKHLICDSFGLPEDNFDLQEEGLPFVGLPISQSRYLDVLQDLCRRTGTMVVFGRDNSVVYTIDPELPLGVWPDIEIEWERANASQVEMERPFRHNVSQVILRAVEPSTFDSFEVHFPPTPLRLGSVEQVDDMVLGGQENVVLAAQLIFHKKNARLTGTVIPAGLIDWVRPGQRHTVTWDLDTEGTYLSGRNFVVTGVQRTIRFGAKDSDPSYSASLYLEELIL